MYVLHKRLEKTPPLAVNKRTEEEIECLHGMTPLPKWTGKEKMHQKEMKAPPVVVAYNLLMNGVDQFNQYRWTKPTMHKRKGLQ